MSIHILLDGGYSMPNSSTFFGRLSLRVGHWLAARHRNIALGKACKISPEARMHPRGGRIVLGDQCTISPGAIVQGNVRMGKCCSVQSYSVVIGYGSAEQEEGVITLGDYVRIAPHVTMLAGNHRFADPGRPIHEQGLELAPIHIGNDVWIAAGARIMAGVSIGEGCVVGAGSVVTKDIPPHSIAAGVPARVIRKRETLPPPKEGGAASGK